MNKKTLSLILIPIFLLIIIPYLSSAPPFLTTTQTGSLEIIAPSFSPILQNQDMDFYWHVFNTTSILTNVTTNCSYHLYSGSLNGTHLVNFSNIRLFNNGRDFEAEIKGGNFSIPGQYCDLIECHTINQTGGLERCFEVTKYGDTLDTSKTIIYLIILFANLIGLSFFIFLSFFIPFDNEQKNTSNGVIVIKVTKTKYIKLMSIWISYALYLAFINILLGLVNGYLSFDPLKIMISNIFIFSSYLGYGLSIFMVWFIFLNIWKDIILNKTILKEGMAMLREL